MNRTRALRALALVATVAGLGACKGMLDVSNPGAISPGNLDDPAMTVSLANSVVGEFQRMYPTNAYWGAILGDEAVTGHNYTQYHDFDMRIIVDGNISLPDVYNPVQRARALGEDIVNHLRTTLGDTASHNVNFATSLAYTGMSNLVLAETFCSAPVDPKGSALTSDDLMRRALTFFDEAIAVGAAAKAADAKVATQADNAVYLARVGAARASLWLNNKTSAISYATPVPASWTLWINQSVGQNYLNNPYYAATTGTNKNLGVDTYFRGLSDPRVRYQTKGQTGHDQKTILYVPYMAESFGTWSGTDSVGFAQDARVRLASGLEAQYLVAEAGGMDSTTLANFINARRTVGRQSAYTGSTPLVELRDQRRRDFFLDGHRLGDLRRYKKLYNVDQFPSGPYVNTFYGPLYGTATCFIPTRTEWIGYPRV